MTYQWRKGDYFAFLFEDNDIICGEILHVLSSDLFLVRAHCAEKAGSSVEEYSSVCLNVRLTKEQFDLAARLGWPMDMDWLHGTLN